ncbi:MAG: hypothetical protein KatS3mg112_0103 [Thermogutta sp.]|nr:MAG: hypothetical protein KatS3mg112_0103 [Thermogutta sp.]
MSEARMEVDQTTPGSEAQLTRYTPTRMKMRGKEFNNASGDC